MLLDPKPVSNPDRTPSKLYGLLCTTLAAAQSGSGAASCKLSAIEVAPMIRIYGFGLSILLYNHSGAMSRKGLYLFGLLYRTRRRNTFSVNLEAKGLRFRV